MTENVLQCIKYIVCLHPKRWASHLFGGMGSLIVCAGCAGMSGKCEN